MTYSGHIEKGLLVLDAPVGLPEGTRVSVEIVHVDRPSASGVLLSERLGSIIGKAGGLPADWSEHHDAHLRDEGTV